MTSKERQLIDVTQPDNGPDHDAILDQLDRILSSPAFTQSGRLQKFLRFIVDETLAGRARHLKEFTIALDVFNRDDTFDPQTSSIVRVEASRLRAKLDKYNRIDGYNDSIHISLPSGRYVPVFESNTLTPEPATPSQFSMRLASLPALFSKKFVVVFVILILAASLVAMQISSTYAPDPESDPLPISSAPGRFGAIAILPLRNLSGEVGQDFFSDGVTDALITALAQNETIRVISTRSVLAYKDADKPIASIAQELGVSHVVEGAVLRIGDSVRITAQLIEVKNNRHLWAETFEHEITDVLELQNEIVQQIVNSLALKVIPSGTRAPTGFQKLTQVAYEAQIKGRFFRNKMTEDGLRKGLQYFQKAIDKQPDYALAYSGMAACYCLLGGHGFELIKPSEALPIAKIAALEALRLNDTLAEPHAFLGIIRLKYEWNWEGAESEFQRSIALNPNYAQARLFYSYFLEAMGRKKEAISEAQEARALDPVSLEANINLGWQFLQDGQLEDARRQFEYTAELSPDFWGVHWGLGHYHRRKGNLDSAVEAFQKANSSGGGHALPLNGLGYTYAISDKSEKALEQVAELNRLSQEGYVSPFNVATIYAGLGEEELAFTWLEKAFVQRSRSMAWLNVLPEFDRLRSNPRFISLLDRIGLESKG